MFKFLFEYFQKRKEKKLIKEGIHSLWYEFTVNRYHTTPNTEGTETVKVEVGLRAAFENSWYTVYPAVTFITLSKEVGYNVEATDEYIKFARRFKNNRVPKAHMKQLINLIHQKRFESVDIDQKEMFKECVDLVLKEDF